jgi:hypothetical protein
MLLTPSLCLHMCLSCISNCCEIVEGFVLCEKERPIMQTKDIECQVRQCFLKVDFTSSNVCDYNVIESSSFFQFHGLTCNV